MGDRLLREVRDGVLLLTWNRPERKNAFDDEAWRAFRDALDEARTAPHVAVVVVTGAGGDFSAGVDLTSFRAAGQPGDAPVAGVAEHPFGRCMQALCAFDKPLVAAARGVAVGFGATFLLHCDLVYVGESLRLRFPFVGLGLVPEAAASFLLPAMIGSRRAAELLFTAEWVGAERALEMGIATRALPDAELLSAALEKAREIASWPVSALQATKQTLLRSREAGVRAALVSEAELMTKLAGSPENVEAVVAFLQKRAPDFARFRTARDPVS
ncbi:MAG: enoyl-CoA hydratase [Myxococcales bacterium]|nr:MAG: enoyl-CoA hydratase [Myxococcales bacterium]